MYDYAETGQSRFLLTEGHDRQLTGGWDELFWLAFEHSATPLWVTRDDRVMVAANRALVELSGYSTGELVGTRDKLVPANWRKVKDRDCEVLLDTGVLIARREMRHRNGTRLRVHLSARRAAVAGVWLTIWMVLGEAAGEPSQPAATADDVRLSPREQEVVGALARGMRVHEAARVLGIAASTVTTHARHAMEKLGARSQAHLVGIALGRELVDPNLILLDPRRPSS